MSSGTSIPNDLAVTLTAADLAGAVAFYDAALGALGWRRVAELVDEEEDDAAVEAVGWAPSGADALVWVVTGSEPTRGAHVRVRAGSPEVVDAFHRAGLAAGGGTHSAPRRWAVYHRGEYGATLADPAGNLLEAVAPE